jgi:Tol biopolymer transport system component
MFSDLTMSGSQPMGVIYQADIEGKSIKPLFDTGDSINSYRVPVLSPDSRWLLTGVHNSSTGPGYQLILYSYPELVSRQITSEPEFTFSAAVWHPSSNSFLFQKIENLDPEAVPSIWLYSLDTGTAVQLYENAFLPGWLP